MCESTGRTVTRTRTTPHPHPLRVLAAGFTKGLRETLCGPSVRDRLSSNHLQGRKGAAVKAEDVSRSVLPGYALV